MKNKHLFIATPAGNGMVNVQYTISLLNTVSLLTELGIKTDVHIAKAGSLLVAERNRILERFWQSDATHLLCIDADLGWPAEAVPAMLKEDKEFIAGLYPARNGSSQFIFRPLSKTEGLVEGDRHLVKMESIPAGFMLISREAIAKMRNKFPELYYSPKDPRNDTESTYCLFNTEVYEGEFWGEDYVFCRRAREAGIEIWCDILIEFDHAGIVGSVSSILQPYDGTNAPVQQTISEAA